MNYKINVLLSLITMQRLKLTKSKPNQILTQKKFLEKTYMMFKSKL